MGSEVGNHVFQIGMGLLSVALVALLVSNAKGAATIIKSVGDTYSGLLGVVTLQSRYGSPFNAS